MHGRRWKFAHRGLAGLWALLLIPTLTLWTDSVLWVAVMSLYANFVGHWSAAQAAEAEERVEDGGGGEG